jgi:hypothetical protein
MAKPVKEKINRLEDHFSKEAVLKSLKYKGCADLLSAVLEEGKTYTSKELDSAIEKFQKGKVR